MCFVLLFCQCLHKELIDFLHVSSMYKSLSLYASLNAKQTQVRMLTEIPVHISYASLNTEQTQVRMLMKIASSYTSSNAEQTPVRKPVYMQVYILKQKFQSECSVKSLCKYQSN